MGSHGVQSFHYLFRSFCISQISINIEQKQPENWNNKSHTDHGCRGRQLIDYESIMES